MAQSSMRKALIMVLTFKNLSADQADTYGLVLSSSGISHRSRKGEHGWDILVNDTEYEKALNAIEQYIHGAMGICHIAGMSCGYHNRQ
jgi:hypothetical protein